MAIFNGFLQWLKPMTYDDYYGISCNSDSASTVTGSHLASLDEDSTVISYEDFTYLIRCGKKDKKLGRILKTVMDGVKVELPF